MVRYSLLVLFWLLAVVAGAQPITGRVTDAKTGQPLPFVNIGVVGKALGTVSNEQGQYGLAFQEQLAADTVRVSYLGYQPRLLTLRQLQSAPNLALTAAAVALAEVRVAGKSQFRRVHTLGNTGNSETSTNTLSNNDLGGQVGTVIKLSRRPTRLRNATFNIARTAQGVVTFRVNIYRLDARGRPTDTKLLTRDIIVTAPAVRGPITVDLSADQLILDENFFLAIEMLKWENATPRAEFTFSAAIGYANNEIYWRRTSQAPWDRASVGALLAGMQPKLSFYVTAED
ncbi:carboxypeptidase-like regulatory domain-containing protein [Hymenobacter sp. H14-R3]|uniref:carboxypeptidase-like regulatory domain-containing protein n=1 Tax=Hymenobacter sp. H14-R3 TaxID=3046308 RepID=UPI0024B90E1E|nr:carboxypeptidase-like regulatory domain-containing protein [Hymenobacter sp. H14-R3]MDJ0366231.1 carboxypeptidase-like regulatory domain-containing protein [Hymenobacter sp. H14-R3]